MANSKRFTTLKVQLYPNAAQAELFEKTFGYPKLKRKKDDRDSFTACNHEFTSSPTIYITKDGLRMTKAGIIPAKFPRCPPQRLEAEAGHCGEDPVRQVLRLYFI